MGRCGPSLVLFDETGKARVEKMVKTAEKRVTDLRGDAFAWANNLLGRVTYVMAPWAVGWAVRLSLRRKRLKPGTARSASSASSICAAATMASMFR